MARENQRIGKSGATDFSKGSEGAVRPNDQERDWQSLGVNRSSSGGWFEGSKTFEYLRQLVPTFLEKLFAEMI